MPESVTQSMLVQQIGSHGLFDLDIEAEGDTWIDDHHTNEDLGMLDVVLSVLCIPCHQTYAVTT